MPLTLFDAADLEPAATPEAHAFLEGVDPFEPTDARPKVGIRPVEVAAWAKAAEADARAPLIEKDASAEWSAGSGPSFRRGWVRRADGARLIETAAAIIDEKDPQFDTQWTDGMSNCGH